MREKKRYLLLKGNFAKAQVEKAIKDYIGLLGYAKASPTFISKNILAVNRKELDNVKAALCLSDENIEIKRASGTLKKLK